MEFLELTKEEFNEVCNNFDGNSFYQSIEWAKIKSKTGWISHYVGVKKKNKIIACSLILGKMIYLNRFIFYAPRGFLLDYNDKQLLTFFTNEIKKFLKRRGGISLKIDPLIIYKNHDKNGNYIEDNFSNQKIIDNLKKLGYKHKGFSIGYSEEAQFRWSYCLDINKSKEELFKEMDQRCRRCIKKYEKYPLEIVEVNDDNINDFKSIMQHTAIRQNHFDRSKRYYKNLKKYLGERCKLVIIYLDKDKFVENFKEDKLFEIINNDERKKIPISAGVFIFDKERANYVYGGTFKEYMSLMAPYKLQMEMIYLSQKKNIPLYDFGGISGNFTPNTENYGVYEFKRGFGGYVVEYIGEFDLVLNKIGYTLYDKGYKIYRNLKHLLGKIKKK